MSVALLLLGIILLGAAAALALRAAAMPGIGAGRRMGRIQAYGFGGGEEVAVRPPSLARLAERLGAAAIDRLDIDEPDLRRQLMGAGSYSLSPAAFTGYRVGATASLSLLFAWLSLSAQAGVVRIVLMTGIGLALGWYGPFVVLRHRARRRFEQIERGLPELVDLLVVTIEAGLGLSSSMQLAASRIDGPLGDELRLTLQEQRMGLSTPESLSHMLARCETPSMRSFVRSILQGETLGVSIGAIMRNLATDMRIRRRQSAEARAQKAPVKILFPLVFLIFPPMYVVLLYPAAYNFMQTFKG
jgi:tight adherence protein C